MITNDDGTSGARGITYETRMCMLCALRGYTRDLRDFKLRYQAKEFEKFDDILFDKGGEICQLFQLKHKEDSDKLKLNHAKLFDEKYNGHYNLLKYVCQLIMRKKSRLMIK